MFIKSPVLHWFCVVHRLKPGALSSCVCSLLWTCEVLYDRSYMTKHHTRRIYSGKRHHSARKHHHKCFSSSCLVKPVLAHQNRETSRQRRREQQWTSASLPAELASSTAEKRLQGALIGGASSYCTLVAQVRNHVLGIFSVFQT